MIETTREELEKWSVEFLEYYKDYIISAKIDEDENLVVVSRPELEFQVVLEHLSDSILDTVSFEEHLDVHLYEYGVGEYVEIGIN